MHKVKRFYSTILKVKNIDVTSQFYVKLGFDVEKSDDAVKIVFGEYRMVFMENVVKDEQLNAVRCDCLSPQVDDGAKRGREGIYLFFEVYDVNHFYTFVQQEKIEVAQEPTEQPWGKIELTIIDPDGYNLVFFKNK